MGGFIDAVSSFVSWIGSVIDRIVDWFAEVLNKISEIVRSFIIGKETVIRNADNPKLFGECMAIRRERGELDEEARRKEKDLSSRDRAKLNECFKDYNYY